MLTLRPFTKNDWYGYAGAESFPDGSEPLIGEIHGVKFDLDGTPVDCFAIAIVDANGLALDLGVEDAEIGDEWGGGSVAAVYFSEAYAARALAALRDGLSFEVIRAMAGAEVEVMS